MELAHGRIVDQGALVDLHRDLPPAAVVAERDDLPGCRPDQGRSPVTR